MTERQLKHLYFPAWRRAWHLGWVVEKGRVRPAPDRVTARDPQLPRHEEIERLAAELAGHAHRAPDERDHRHACHLFAFGRDLDTNRLTDDQLDRIVNCFAVLADPDDIDATLDWLHPERPRRRRLLWRIEHCGLDYDVRVAICRAACGVEDWHSLHAIADLERLLQVCQRRAWEERGRLSRAPRAPSEGRVTRARAHALAA